MLVLVIIFVAYRHRTVVLATHIVVLSFLIFLAYNLGETHQV
jgi:hypothetical protein